MRALFWFGLLALLLLILAVFTPSPFRSAFSGTGLPFLKTRATAATAVSTHMERLPPVTASERARLKHLDRLVQQLNQQVRNGQDALRENRELRLYLELPAPPDWKLVVAPIISRDPVTWNRRFRIGKGSASGIYAGAAVMAGNQVVGRVLEVSAGSALVATVADPACRLSVRLPVANAIGILSGRVDQRWHETPVCLVNFLPRDQAYAEDEYVITSGLGGSIPSGLPVGRVMPWDDGKPARIVSSAYAQLLVRPSAEFNVFSNVAVVVPRGPTPLPDGGNGPGIPPAEDAP